MSTEESRKETSPNECPVCYEQLKPHSILERRLSCGHSFCHDCLVKYLLAAKQEGSIKKNIICPLCRYVTFLNKRGLILPPKPGEANQILEVPISPSCQRHCETVTIPETLVLPIPETEETPERQEPPVCTCQTVIGSEGLVNSFGSQVFIISNQGQPLENEDSPPRRPATQMSARDHLCRSPVLIGILLLVFLVAVLAAVLPWILLAKRV
ncbi:hypothetical protein GDO86_018142 [Hymenochirus boettgeri]|uniref:RING-type domain-containing protein n=1 Tax=Hymenochirus boettgeri TaxID=247094 RepID=A0A8T2IHW2_9PIPI|nr:hypothetical protein GDO86_018142 [Hymenochirus boettgeri]